MGNRPNGTEQKRNRTERNRTELNGHCTCALLLCSVCVRRALCVSCAGSSYGRLTVCYSLSPPDPEHHLPLVTCKSTLSLLAEGSGVVGLCLALGPGSMASFGLGSQASRPPLIPLWATVALVAGSSRDTHGRCFLPLASKRAVLPFSNPYLGLWSTTWSSVHAEVFT